MPVNKLTFGAAALSVVTGACMIYIMTSETFAVAKLGGDEECQVGTLGVFSSSYTPGCAALPGSAFEAKPTLEFWPLFAQQNGFGGAFEADIGINASEPGEDWPSEAYDCEAGLAATAARIDAFVSETWVTVSLTLQGAIQGLVTSKSGTPSAEDPDFFLKTFGAAQLAGAAVLEEAYTAFYASNPPGTTTGDICASIAADLSTECIDNDSALLTTSGLYGKCVIKTLYASFAGSCPCPITGDANVATDIGAAACLPTAASTLTGIAVTALGPDTNSGDLTAAPAVAAGLGAVYNSNGDSNFAGTYSSWPALFKFYVADVLAAYNGPNTAITGAAPSAPLIAGFAQGCLTIGQLTGAPAADWSTVGKCAIYATLKAGIPDDLTEKHILACVLDGTDKDGPNKLTCGASNVYDVFKYFNPKEVEPLVTAEQAAAIGQVEGFQRLINGCGDAYTAAKQGSDLASLVAPTPVEEGTARAICQNLVPAVHVSRGADQTKIVEDGDLATTNEFCAVGDLSTQVLPIFQGTMAALTLKTSCQFNQPATVANSVLGGVYSLNLTMYTAESGADVSDNLKLEGDELFGSPTDPATAVKRDAANRQVVLKAALAKCNDDNEDAKAISNAQSLTPVGTGMVFVGALVGLITAFKGPKLAPLGAAVLVISGAVLFTVALLGVRNAPVYSLIGQPCPDGNVCYSAATGNKMALPTIASGLVSGILFAVSAFVCTRTEDYSSFQETQVGTKA